MKISISDLIHETKKLPTDKRIREYRVPVFESPSIYRGLNLAPNIAQAKYEELKFERDSISDEWMLVLP